LRLPGEDNAFVAPLFQLSNLLAAALTPLAIVSVGLMFKLPRLEKIVVPLVIVILLKPMLKPLLAGAIALQLASRRLGERCW
jgi:predicted permease